MAKRYDPIMCMMVDKLDKAQDAKSYGKYKLPNGEIVEVIDRKNVHGVDTIVYKNSRGVHFATVDWFMSNAKKVYDSASAIDKAKDELSLAQKKQVVNELKGYLKKSYNFGDESEYARAYEDLRHMFTTGSRKSISGLFENTVKKTGAHDAKAKDRLVKVPDNKLKDFEASLRSAGFKVVSKSDRGRSTHYQVEVSSDKEFTKDDLREWAKKIDAVCDKMDSVAPTTWNIGLTADGKITAGLDVREMYVKDSASALDKAIKVCDASTGHKVVVFVENYLRSIGKNNSAGKYDKIVHGVKSLLSQSLLDDEGLKKAAEHEADRLLKKYNL